MSDQREKIINVDRRDAVALVTLNDEAGQNALTSAMVEELSGVFRGLQRDSEVRAIILTGTEKAFSAGVDIEELEALTTEQAKNFARAGELLTNLLENLGKPVIAAINGLASGAGCELALSCIWRVASANATFAQPETFRGWGQFRGASRLSRIIGNARALEMILTGEPIKAEEALRIGLVTQVIEKAEELLPFCERLAHRISRNAPLAVRYALEAVNHGSEVSLSQGLRLESALFGLCLATRDVEEGTKAFLEKRQPDFTGN